MRRKWLGVMFIALAVCIIIFKVFPRKKVEEPLEKVEEQSPYKKYGYNIEKCLSKYKMALKESSNRKVKIYCIGESITRGEYSSDEVNKSWVGVLKHSLQNKYGNAGEGFISVYEGALPYGTNPRWRLGEQWSVLGVSRHEIKNLGGVGGCFATSNKSNSSSILKFNGTDLELLYSKSIDGGTALVKIDGKNVGTINCFGDKSSFSNKAYYSGLHNSSHTLEIIPNSSSSVFIEGAIASSSSTGIEVDKIAISSKAASYFNTELTKKNWNALKDPDLVFISFGINESRNKISVNDYKSNMAGLVAYWMERGSNVCLIIGPKPADSWTTNWSDYVDAVYEVSNEYNTAVIDIYKAYFKDYEKAKEAGLFGMPVNDYSGGSGSNTAHPSDKGYKYIGDIIFENLQ